MNFRNYVKALHTPDNYDYVSDDLVMVATEIFKREIHMYNATVGVQIFRPRNGISSKGSITIAFFEPTRYVYLRSVFNGVSSYKISHQQKAADVPVSLNRIPPYK